MKYNLFFIPLLLFVLFFAGCSDSSKPSDFPKVYPMTVTVKDGGTVLSNIRLVFYPIAKKSGLAYAPSGSTDEMGLATIKTAQGAYVEEGIPVGEYVITLADMTKIDKGVPPEVEIQMSREERAKLAAEYKKKLDAYVPKVPAILNRTGAAERKNVPVEDRSPIRFTAKEESNELTVDVSEYKR